MSAKQFFAGFSAGIGLIAGELIIFASSLIFTGIENVAPGASSVSSDMQIVFIAFDLVQNLSIGFLAPKDFAWGFLAGDLAMLVAVGGQMWDTLPSVVLGMIVAFVIVAIALVIRITSEGQRDETAWW